MFIGHYLLRGGVHRQFFTACNLDDAETIAAFPEGEVVFESGVRSSAAMDQVIMIEVHSLPCIGSTRLYGR